METPLNPSPLERHLAICMAQDSLNRDHRLVDSLRTALAYLRAARADAIQAGHHIRHAVDTLGQLIGDGVDL